MPANTLKNAPENRFIEAIKQLKREMRAIRTNQNAIMVIPGYASDPASPIENQIWVNTTAHTLKIYINGVVKTATLT